MGTKRRNAVEPPAGFSAVSTERPPPLKTPRTALDSAPSSAASRFGFGFKGPSLTKLPPPAAASRTGHAAPPVGHEAESARALPISISIDLDLHVRDAFAGSFSSETLASLDELLAFRHKTNKFAVKARKEEQIAYIKRLKAALRDVAGKAQEFSTTAATMDSKITSEKATLERRIAVLQEAARSKDQADREVAQLRDQNEELKKLVTRLHASEQEAIRRNTTLQDDSALQQQQLQEARKLQDQMKLDLAAQKTRLADQTQHFESEKTELERFFQKKTLEEDLRKQTEVDRLQEELSKTRAETSAALEELSALKDKAVASAEELNRERERRTKSEMEKCTLEAKNQALDARVNSAMSEAVELKDKFKQKDEEVSSLVKSLTEIQKFNASASSKVDTEKKELTEKIEKLQASNRDLERKEATSNTTIRDLRKQLEADTASRKAAEGNEQHIRARLKTLEVEVQESTRKASVEGGVRQMLEEQMRELRMEHVAVNAQMEAVKSELKRRQSADADSKSLHQKEIAALQEQFRTEKEAFSCQIDKLQEIRVSLESEVKTLRDRASTVRDGDVEELCEVKREADVLRRRLNELSNQGAHSIAQKDALILELQEKVKHGDKLRRAMHNTIQELRGNVRVFARTRPFLPSDHCDPNAAVPVISCDFDGQSLKLRRPGKKTEPDTFAFTFDKVFAPSAGQDAVFEDVAEFVQSSLDGYHVCLFSYGQTGSGKTHTMQGSGNGQMRGIIPRSINKVLEECEVLKLQGWSYTTQVSFLEIYNESLKDLLASTRGNDDKLTIKKDPKGGVHVPGLTLVDVTAIEQIEALMERANRARSVACTDMNAQSSRSHSVFTLHLQGVNDKDGVMLNGELNLVDLAGSERASRSNVSGERLKETQAINKSLSCLADVFNAIGNKASHIPFRNSKLTYLLQSSLSGDGKTLMMVNLSPTVESASESLCSLRFAKQVNQCELGKPKRQIKSRKDH